MPSLTPSQAGQRAEELAKQQPLPDLHLDTRLAHAGIQHGTPNAPLAPPLHTATTSTRPASGAYGEGDRIYTRHDNATRQLLETEMAALEGGMAACAFGSGMMAASAIILAHSAPLTVILPLDTYHGVPTVLTAVFARFGVVTKQVDMQSMNALQVALEETSTPDVIVWMETPSNPKCMILDIEAICQVCRDHERRPTTVVDSTLAPPPLHRPLGFGANLILHSATKSLAGHSDALIGIVTAVDDAWGHRLHEIQTAMGGVASPWDSWLTLRGLRTLALRCQRQSSTALALAEYLNEHPMVALVHYPGLPSHPNHAVAAKQMTGGFGGVLSIEMPDETTGMALAGALTVVTRATSLGGTETLIEHRASIEPPTRRVSPPGLLRISVGLEDPHDLIRDFEQALAIVKQVKEEGNE